MTTNTQTEKAQHTPTPWRQNGSLITAQGDMKLTVASLPSGEDARKVYHDAAAKTFAVRDANARFILRAVNSHADLVAALETAARQFDFTVAAMAKGQTVSISSLQNCAANARAILARHQCAAMADECAVCGVGFILPSGTCDHCDQKPNA